MSYNDNDNAKFWRDFCITSGKLYKCKKGARLSRVLDGSRYLGYIVSGALKQVAFGEEGEEHVLELMTENDFISDYPFEILGDHRKFDLIAVTESAIFCVPLTSAISVTQSNSAYLFGLSNLVLQRLVSSFINLYTKTPERRYLDLLKNHSHLLELFSLGDIASYLNVTRTHLSRIRNNLSKM